jgi:serine/threonine protein kinase
MPNSDPDNPPKPDSDRGMPSNADEVRNTVPIEAPVEDDVCLTSDMAVPAPAADFPSNAERLPFFGRYEARSVLGAGGFGMLYLGYDPQLARAVAIKVLRGGAGVSTQKVDEFLSEARRLAQLHHPGIE